MLLFTPELASDPWSALDACLPWVDVIQVRPKELGAGAPPTFAREAFELCERVLERTRSIPANAPLVLVNDRVDVAAALLSSGLAGVHLGEEDCPIEEARALLGPRALIGVSTHDLAAVGRAEEAGANYIGLGPAFPTTTKGYEVGLSPERIWVADQATAAPVFPIGGITEQNAFELAQVGRAAVGSAILGAEDPARAARVIRALLAETGDGFDARA